MTWSELKRLLNLTSWWTRAVIAAVVLLVIFGLLTYVDHLRTAAARAGAAGQISAAQAAAGRDAVALQDQALNAATQSTDLTRESDHVIHAAPGADQRLDPDLNRTGRQRLCLRSAYRHDPQCLQHPGGANAAR